jgi:hypothetical protein
MKIGLNRASRLLFRTGEFFRNATLGFIVVARLLPNPRPMRISPTNGTNQQQAKTLLFNI